MNLVHVGSGKKYKRCCLLKDQEKKSEELSFPAKPYIDEALKEFPKMGLLKFYDEDTVEIDEYLYKALKHKPVPIFVKRNYTKENELNIQYIEKAFELMKKKCEKDKIKDIEEFDNKISIHYNLMYVIDKYIDLLSTVSLYDDMDLYNEYQYKKVNFVIRLTDIFGIRSDITGYLLDRVIAEYIDDDDDYDCDFPEKILKEIIKKDKTFIKPYIKLVDVYNDCYKSEKILFNLLDEAEKNCGPCEEIDARRIAIYIDLISEICQEDRDEAIKYSFIVWNLVLDVIKRNNLKTEYEYNEFEYKYYEDIKNFCDILYEIDDALDVLDNNEIIDKRITFLSEVEKSILIESESSKETIAVGLVNCYYALGKEQEALNVLNKFKEEFPNNAIGIISEANLYISKEPKDYSKAIEILLSALKSNKNIDKKSLIYSSLAFMYEEINDEENAVKYQNMAIEENDEVEIF